MATQKQPVKASIAAFVGTMVEWYDFYIYGTAAALVLGQLSFLAELRSNKRSRRSGRSQSDFSHVHWVASFSVGWATDLVERSRSSLLCR